MISDERRNEMEDCFWTESNDEETQEWRSDLNDEEIALVDTWDSQYASGLEKLIGEIAKHS